MGLCSSSQEIPKPGPMMKRYNSYIDVWQSASFHESPVLLGSQPSPCAKEGDVEREVQREVDQATSSNAWSRSSGDGESLSVLDDFKASSNGSSVSSDRLRCECGVAVGSEVLLSSQYARFTDALEGNLTPGDVGIVSEIDDGSELYCVQHEGSKWWYQREAIKLSRCRQPQICSRITAELEASLEEQLKQACQMSTKVASMACLRWNTQLRMIHPA